MGDTDGAKGGGDTATSANNVTGETSMTEAALDPLDPQPGIYRGVPMSTYLALPCLSASALEVFRRSPQHYRAGVPKEPTDAMELGSAIHMGLMEPDLFRETYVEATPCAAPLASGKRKGEPCGNPGKLRSGGAWFCGTHAPDEHDTPEHVVDHVALGHLNGMVRAIRAHPRASTLFQGAGGVEVTGIFRDPETGLLIKIRPDRLIARAKMKVDVKTTRDAEPSAFARDAANRGYHRKVALYRRGLRELGWDCEATAICAVESAPPYVVAAYLMDEAQIERAERDVVRLLHRYAMCRDGDYWPGYGDEFRTLTIPDWAFDAEPVTDETTIEEAA